ncbi:Hypothetical_protein [Hexamita inflata]|uniref:Hypothetical_protein n=1 Tax=Hexamita inflata TaxID=28002 RepID=A0ABP1HK59_9EUKA
MSFIFILLFKIFNQKLTFADRKKSNAELQELIESLTNQTRPRHSFAQILAAQLICQYGTDYSFLQKVVDLDMSGFFRSQIITLVVCVAAISVVEIARDLFLQYCKHPRKTRTKIQIKDFDELE